ncbi:hypothetical protein D9758_005013 [Tetrapyrgos nigripes]|uniref:Uncharacterized protein n=1 Tax=Tetrapyrgos nigripes TaxID=182062 RepID=A0A8H5GW21_9AGAR|nr:hypothetical protein D9758_005013 [Tetrapyrgos nigripes]
MIYNVVIVPAGTCLIPSSVKSAATPTATISMARAEVDCFSHGPWCGFDSMAMSNVVDHSSIPSRAKSPATISMMVSIPQSHKNEE